MCHCAHVGIYMQRLYASTLTACTYILPMNRTPSFQESPWHQVYLCLAEHRAVSCLYVLYFWPGHYWAEPEQAPHRRVTACAKCLYVWYDRHPLRRSYDCTGACSKIFRAIETASSNVCILHCASVLASLTVDSSCYVSHFCPLRGTN